MKDFLATAGAILALCICIGAWYMAFAVLGARVQYVPPPAAAVEQKHLDALLCLHAATVDRGLLAGECRYM